jgi:hypothetical protein
MQTQSFQITRPSNGGGGGQADAPFIDPLLLIIIFISIGSVAGIGITSYVAIKKVREKRRIRRKKLRSKILDILNLQDIIIISTKTGLNVYDEHYSGTAVDATLVSGFLEAIRSFGIELTGSQEQTQSISLVYKELIVVMSEFKSVRVLVIMKERPSKEFHESIDQLSVEIEQKFGEEMRNELAPKQSFFGIHELIKTHLNTAFVLPLQLEKQKDIKLSTSEKQLVIQAKQVMKKRDKDHFFSTFLLSGEKLNIDKIELIFDLIEKGIFKPMHLKTNEKLNSGPK